VRQQFVPRRDRVQLGKRAREEPFFKIELNEDDGRDGMISQVEKLNTVTDAPRFGKANKRFESGG